MPVNATQRLIRICDSSNDTPTTPTMQNMKNQPIAAQGFWADASVPLSAGVDTWKTKAPKVQACTPPKVPLLASLPFDRELEVRDRLASAKEMAGVGDDIRWDLIIEEAAKLQCGLRGVVPAQSELSGEKAKGRSADDDADLRSTSASDGENALDSDTTELEVSSQDEAAGKGQDTTAGVFGAKLPPWRRSRHAAETDKGRETSEVEPSATLRPWRRTSQKGKADASAHVYTISTLLQCWASMQREINTEVQLPPVADAPSTPDVSASSSGEEKDARTSPPAASNPPWRRRPGRPSGVSE
jgi:hypothetical protein